MILRRIAVLGGGPAGLYFAYRWKRRQPESEVEVFEQNPAGATFGFGVVFSDRALDFLRQDDPETADLIAPRMEAWQDITLVHRGKRIAIDGVGFSAIGRLEFLALLQERARSVGVEPRYGVPVRSVDELQGLDLVVAADGVNSLLRRALDGHPLISNKSAWRNFPWIWNERWSHRNIVLVGDALRTAHFSIGSGTRLALEDAIALVNALDAAPDLPAALATYEAARRPIVEKLVAASKASAAWYERFASHMRLDPLDFAMSYITRSGRVDRDRLRAIAPRFMAGYDAAR